MARSLRPRKARPSYASLIDSGDELVPEEDGGSSDDFRPQNEQDGDAEDVTTDGSDVEMSLATEHDLDEVITTSKPSRSTEPQKSKTRQDLPISSNAQGSAPTARVASYNSRARDAVLDHRYRAEALYLRPARVERLTQRPGPFKSSDTTSTPCWNSTKACSERLIRLYAYCIGRGPAWELLEDRAWWKESLIVGEGLTETEATRRPRVYESINGETTYTVINAQEAREYLPSSAEGSNEYSKSTIKCHFGPPHKNVVKELETFASFETLDDPSGAKSLVFYAGGPVWGLDWCPIYAEDQPHRSFRQYIAVAPLPSKSHFPHIGQKCTTPFPACIQIWSYSEKYPQPSVSHKGKGKATDTDPNSDFGKMTCDLVLCIDCGPVQEIKWCPLPAHDSWTDTRLDDTRRLGLLAGTFEDGSLCIFSVPDPEDVHPITEPEQRPLFVRIQPIIRIELDETCFLSLDWANSERIAVGCTNGSIAVYDIRDALLSSNNQAQDILPTHYFSIHQAAIRSVRWISVPTTSADGKLNFMQSPTMVTSGGYDGCEIITDIREGCGNVLNRTRDVALTVAYSRFTEAVVSIDVDYTVKAYSMAPSILGRGSVVVEAGGPIWNLHTSDYHPFIAVGSADGSVLIANMLRASRRSAATPFVYFKAFQMDYSTQTGEYRMLDQFLPQELPDRSNFSGKKDSKHATEIESVRNGVQGTGVWPPEVSVTRVAWNNVMGLARSPLLASATTSGLCRVDWLLGHFQGGQLPYDGVESTRNSTDSFFGTNECEEIR